MYEGEDSKKYARYNLHYRILSPNIEGFVFFFFNADVRTYFLYQKDV